MTRIVTTHYRYKRPPRKRAKAAAIEGPVIATAKRSRRPADQVAVEAISRSPGMRAGAAQPSIATDAARDGTVTEGKKWAPADDDRKSAIVTARKPAKRYGDVPGVTEEEHGRVGDLADAMFQEMKRRIAAKIGKSRT